MELNKIYNENCLEGMKRIEGKSIDMILCDLPYGTTASKWDSIIPADELWEQYERVIKDDGAIVLTASGQFTHKLIQSNVDLYKYKWIWVKTKKGNFVNAKNRPMTSFEEVLVFSKGNTANGSINKMKYHPQGLVPTHIVNKDNGSRFGSMAGKRPGHKKETIQNFTNYPHDVLHFDSVGKSVHPTQKPVALFEYLIKTYTNEDEVVLDNCMGSGTTAIACINTNRNYIGFELDETYFEVAQKRIEKLIEEEHNE
ncbi:MAG TPA: site-specific DNA-methyltransferase [Oscillospiraceae bacterium]|nr:site-specific DNA-methyltransferase [Oscillospiraceae bacterium]